MTPRDDFDNAGFCVARNFYDRAEIEAIVEQIDALGGGPAMYEGAKQVPALYRLIVSPKNFELIAELRPGFQPGIAEGGVQVRADMPHDETWRACWHQDSAFQGRSASGLIFWTPLASVTQDMGPVELCVGSHKEGVLPIYNAGPGEHGRSRAYAWEIVRRDEIISKYNVVAPLLNVGDLLVMDYHLIHQSGHNVSDRPRWSGLWRYFDYLKGVEMGWRANPAFGPKT